MIFSSNWQLANGNWPKQVLNYLSVLSSRRKVLFRFWPIANGFAQEPSPAQKLPGLHINPSGRLPAPLLR